MHTLKLEHVPKLYISIHNFQWYWKLNKQKHIILYYRILRLRLCHWEPKAEMCDSRPAGQPFNVWIVHEKRENMIRYVIRNFKLYFSLVSCVCVCGAVSRFGISRFFDSHLYHLISTCSLQIWHIIIALGGCKFCDNHIISFYCFLIHVYFSWYHLVQIQGIQGVPKWINSHFCRRSKYLSVNNNKFHFCKCRWS